MDSGNHTQTLCKSSMLLNTELDLQPYFKKFIRKNQFDIKRPVSNTVKTEGSRARALIPVTTGMRQGRWLFLPAEPACQAPETADTHPPHHHQGPVWAEPLLSSCTKPEALTLSMVLSGGWGFPLDLTQCKPAGKKGLWSVSSWFPNVPSTMCLNQLFKVSIYPSFLSVILMKYPNRKQHI